MFRTRIAGLVLLFSLWIPALFAKEKPQIRIRVEEGKEAKLDTTAQAEVLLPKDIAGAAKSLPKLLERVAGIQIKRYGGLDDYAAVSIRGSTADQVLIYLDGILLNSAQGGLTDLSFLSLDQIARIEIYRGGSPGKIVDSTPGGVLYIHTKGRPEKTRNLLRNSLGSFYSYRGHAGRSQSFEKLFYHADFDYYRSRGDFSFLDDRGTRANTNDDRVIHRQNNDFETFHVTTTLGQATPQEDRWQIFETIYHKEGGIPGLGNSVSTSARLKTLRNFIHGSLSSPYEQSWEWKTDLFFDFLRSRFDDPLGEIGLGTQNNEDLTFRFGPQFHSSYPVKNHLLSGFVAHRTEFFSPTNHTAANPDGPLSGRHMIAFGVEDEMTFFEDKIIVDPSVRFQIFVNHLSGSDPSQAAAAADNNATDKQVSAKLGIKITPWRFLFFKANFFRGFRQPTFSELFGDRGTLVGNPSLSPEEALNFDLGLTLRLRDIDFLNKLDFTATFYRHSVENLIQFLQTSQFTAKAQNLNSALILGGEFGLRLQLFENWRWSSSYVYQSAKDKAPNSPTFGRFLPGRPKHQFFAESDYRYRFLRPFTEIQILSRNFLDAQNLLRVDNRMLMTAGLAVEPSEKWSFTFQTKNLLNNRIADIAGFPLPGRSYWGELTLNL